MDVRDVSIPEPQDGELLIRVHLTRDFASPFVTGMDGAGVVERTCSDNYSREKAKGDSNERFKQRTGRDGKRIWKSWQTNLDHRDLSISMIHEPSMRHSKKSPAFF